MHSIPKEDILACLHIATCCISSLCFLSLKALQMQSVHTQRNIQSAGCVFDAGEELLLDYSQEFWGIQKKHQQDIRRHEREVQV